MEKRRLVKIKKPKTPSENDILKILQNKIIKIDKKIKRLERLTYRLKQNQRAARTRTLIQLGGLLVKSGIAEKLGIEIGADLQREEDQKKKAYVLLGMFINQLSIPKKIEEFEQLGKQFLFETQDDVGEKNMKEVTENFVTV